MIKVYVKGQTLLELMISLTLSSFLLLIILAFYTDSQQQNQQLFQQLQLQTEMQKIIQLISKDLRRSGFRAIKQNNSETNLSLFEGEGEYKSLVISSRKHCVVFFYDLNADGCIGSKKSGVCLERGYNATKMIEKELFGYRLNHGMVETRSTYKNSVNQSCNKTECQAYTSEKICANNGGWTDLLDAKEYEILDLIFERITEKGLHIYLKGRSKLHPEREYDTSAIVPLMNER